MGNSYGVSEESFRPYRHLAIRVLARALSDLVNPHGAPADRESARVFLDRSGMLGYWCRVAALDPTAVVALAYRLGGGSRPMHAVSVRSRAVGFNLAASRVASVAACSARA
jgi:hypothetical protein